MRTAAVIGANGFLGQSIVQKLLHKKLKVIAVYNLNSININPKANLVNKDVFLESTFDIDYIYLACGSYSNSYSQLLNINKELFFYIQKYPSAKFIYISSTNVYGDHTIDINELSCFNKPNAYGMFKLAGEFLISSLDNFSIIRFTYLYGPGIMNKSFLPTIIRSAKERSEIILFGRGERYQDYLYIDDAVEFCYRCSNIKENRIYLAASGRKTTNKEVAISISKNINCKIKYKDVEKASSYGFDPSKTFDFLKWRPSTDFTDGLMKMIR